MSFGLSVLIHFTSSVIPRFVLANCLVRFSPSTATSNQSLATSIPIKCSLSFGMPASRLYNRTMPALVNGLQDLPTVRAQLHQDTATPAARRSRQDLPTVGLPCPPLSY